MNFNLSITIADGDRFLHLPTGNVFMIAQFGAGNRTLLNVRTGFSVKSIPSEQWTLTPEKLFGPDYKDYVGIGTTVYP